MTSDPSLIIELSFLFTNVSTFSITVSYFVYKRPYKIIGSPNSTKSFFVYPLPFEKLANSPNLRSSQAK